MYQVLYRKYRPRVFADVVGQPHVTRVLAGEVAAGRLSHAYLFTGSRGTGKTTCSRIFAKAVCCEHPVNGDPCGECEICRGIDNGSMLDYSEMDAASNRSIEDIRRIREEAWVSPAAAKYRIFVLDEVHMLTGEAFNALLKILEEPPEHVIFILATTDVQKLPGTVLSRCQRFDFVRIDSEVIADRLIWVAEQEGRVLTRDGAALIAGMADGAMRDALSILDRCLSEDGEIDARVVSSVTGLVGRDALFRLSDAICAGDTSAAVGLVDEFHRASCDSERLCSDLLAHFRAYMIAKTVKKPEDILVCTREDLEKYRLRASRISMEQILYYIDILSQTGDKLRKSTNGRVDAEMAVIRLCSPEAADTADALKSRIARLEQQIVLLKKQLSAPSVSAVPPVQAPAAPVSPPESKMPAPVPQNTAALEEADMPPWDTKADGESPPMPFSPPAGEMPEDDEPMALPFGDAPEDDEPMVPPFGNAPEDDEPMALPFGDAPEDDEPMALPFGDAPEDDEPMAPPFGDEPEDDEPMAPPFGDAPEDDEPMSLPFGGEQAPPIPQDAPPENPELYGEEPGKVRINQGNCPYWSDICAEAKRVSPPLIGLIDGSSASLNGDTLILSSVNPLFSSIVAKNDHMKNVIRAAAEKVSGRALQLKFV